MSRADSPTSRRILLAAGIGLAGLRASKAASQGSVFRFRTEACHVHLSVEFHDRFTGRGPWLVHSFTRDKFCPSSTGDEKHCATSFAGSVAIVRYELRPHTGGPLKISTMREHVRTIDWDERLEPRPPYHRTVALEGGFASDVQAFGLTGGGRGSSSSIPAAADSPWYYYRQDLYLDSQKAPFLIIHWKHSLHAIRMLDIIPTGGTSVVAGE